MSGEGGILGTSQAWPSSCVWASVDVRPRLAATLTAPGILTRWWGRRGGSPRQGRKPMAVGQAGLCCGQTGGRPGPTTGCSSDSRLEEEPQVEKGMRAAPLLGPGGGRQGGAERRHLGDRRRLLSRLRGTSCLRTAVRGLGQSLTASQREDSGAKRRRHWPWVRTGTAPRAL